MLTPAQIKFLNWACSNKWSYDNNVINVMGNVNMSFGYYTEFPVHFGYVLGNFACRMNKLTSLQGGPTIINGYFDCDHNKLTSLAGGPKKIGSFYSCSHNKLTSLIGAPKIIENNFICDSNLLTTLKGCPKLIEGGLYCRDNKNLHILYGIYKVHTIIHDNNNEINKWIIEQKNHDIFVTYKDIARWITKNNKFEYLYKNKEIYRCVSMYIKKAIKLNLC